MRPFLGSLFLALSVAMLSGCTSECGPGADCPDAQRVEKKAAPDMAATPSRVEADSYFAMFMNDPTNRESWHWLCRAAAGGHSAAQYAIAVRYRDGLPPVRRNLQRAYRWFTAAQDQGLTAAALARESLARQMSESQTAELRKHRRQTTEADCRES